MYKREVVKWLRRCQKALDVTFNKVDHCDGEIADDNALTLNQIVVYLRDVFNAVDAAEKRQTFDDLIKD